MNIFKKNIKDSEQALVQLQEEFDALNEQFDTASKEVISLTEQVATLQSEFNRVSEENETLKLEVEKLNTEVAEVAKESAEIDEIATEKAIDIVASIGVPAVEITEEQEEEIDVKERNIFAVLVNRDNALLVENEYAQLEDLRERAKEFMENPTNDENLPEKEPKDIEFFGEVMVTKGVISLRNDLDTKYGTYIAVQNELVAAINELRDELAKQHFGKPYNELEKEEQDAIRQIYPSRISEAEPKKRN